jgi:beta-glucuronidase
MHPKDDLYYDLVDIISHNLYPGWYGCEDVEDPLALIVPRIRECLASIDERGQAAKPYILSKIGAEALYGWRDSLNGFFTEEYQAKYLETVVREVEQNPRIAGVALWHFSDARTYSGGRALMRPRAFNNKGTLDEYRRPKQAYDAVKSVWCSITSQKS